MGNRWTLLYAALATASTLAALGDTGVWYLALKPAPIWLAAGLLLWRLPRTASTLLPVAALLFGSAGDIVLELEGMFVPGIGAFLIGHLLYSIAFFREAVFRPERLLPAGLIALYLFLMAYLLAPELGGLAIPVFAYVAVSALFGLAAAFRRGERQTVLAGAVVFLASDTLIAINRFLSPIAYDSLWILASYYLAQFLIAEGIIRDSRERASHRGEL